MAGTVAFGSVRLVLLGVYSALSVFSFIAYGMDKAAARRGGRRTSEARLHLISLFGGWPGALLAQRVFRHKTRKRSFRVVFWLTVAANCVVAAALYSILAAASG